MISLQGYEQLFGAQLSSVIYELKYACEQYLPPRIFYEENLSHGLVLSRTLSYVKELKSLKHYGT